MSSFNKDAGGRQSATVWRRRRKVRRARPADDNDFHPLVRGSVVAARDYLRTEQDAGLGAWCGRVPADPHVTAEYLLLLDWLGLADERRPLVESLRAFLQESVNSKGAWSDQNDMLDVSTSTLCYLALKMSGSDADDPFMSKVRASIRSRGGAEVVNGLTRYYLALYGQDSFDRCPVLPPEFLLLPRWLPMNVTRWSRWARAILVPLSVLWALRPVRKEGTACEVDELYLNPATRAHGHYVTGLSESTSLKARWWQFNARIACTVTRAIERAGLRPFRRTALRAAEKWMAERLDEHNGIAGSTTATVLAAIAFDALQHPSDSVPQATCLRAIENALSPAPLRPDDSNAGRDAMGVSPARVAIQDTAIVAHALAIAGLDPHTNELRQGIEWLLQNESTRPGDWSQVVKTDPGGWSREFPNHFYPHITATARVLQSMREPFANNPPSSLVTDDSMVAMIRANSMNLAKRQIAVLDRVAAASRRARLWLLAMQNGDGGWPCADRHHSRSVLYSRRFSDRFPIHDLSNAEATGAVLQALGTWEMGCGQSSVDRGVSYLRELQTAEGCWKSVHGGSDIAATASVILGLRAVGISWRDMTISRAADWLIAAQQSDGGWLANSYDTLQGPVTCPRQTAWALMALEQAGKGEQDVAHRAAQYLVDRQQVTGSWLAHAESPAGGADLVECESELSQTAIPLTALAIWGLGQRVLD